MTFSLQARVVFPVDCPAIEHGAVTIEGERVVAVGAKFDGGEIIDLGNVALLPGLVNAHTHLEFSHLKRPLGAPRMPLVDWIRLVIAERGRRDNARANAMRCGLRESVGHGVTSIGDIAAGKVPVFAPGVVDATHFFEVIGFSQARASSSLSELIERLDFMQQALSELEVSAVVNTQIGISPHAPYTVSPGLLGQLIELARDRSLPVAMHLAESEDELELLDVGRGPFQELLDERSMWDAGAIPGGSRPLDYLRKLAEAPRALVIHGNYLDDEERTFLASNADRMSLVYCPRTHAYFGHPPYPLSKLLSAGVRIALGTDSRASNPDLDLLAEMRHVARTFPAIDPNDILRMGTLAGAEALGRATDAGSITPGKLANLVAVPLPPDSAGSANDLLNVLLADTSGPSGVWLRGIGS